MYLYKIKKISFVPEAISQNTSFTQILDKPHEPTTDYKSGKSSTLIYFISIHSVYYDTVV